MTNQANHEQFDPFALHGDSQGKSGTAPLLTEIFDPFGLGPSSPTDEVSSAAVSSVLSPAPPPEVTRVTTASDNRNLELGFENARGDEVDATESVASKRSVSVALPPKLLVRFTVHEEVSSVAHTGVENEGSSDVHVEGVVCAQVQSSDAFGNAPFDLVASTLHESGRLNFQPNEEFVSQHSNLSRGMPSQALHLVKIPKDEIGSVEMGKFTLSEKVRHMPLLVERKVTMYASTCRVAVQVRSKLSNNGDMSGFSIVAAMPEDVDGETVEILKGEGKFDELKRTIMWKRKALPKGESFMVSAQAQMWSSVGTQDQQNVRFPVLVRCSASEDQISSAEFRATEADGYPATVSFHKTQSFRLLHRLP